MPIEKSRDPKRFAEFELSGWDAHIGGYESAFGTLVRQSVASMLDAASVMRGMEVLEICCGPAMLTAAALQRGAKATGLDFSEQAVALARKRIPDGQFQQGDAQALPFKATSFDAVLCGYGLIHLPDPEAALREMLRVLRPGGRAAVSVWDAAAVGFTLVYDAVRACGRIDVALPHGPDFFQFGTPERAGAALKQAGFADVRATFFDQSWRVPDVERYFESILSGTVRASAVLAAQSSAAAAAVRSYIADYLTRYQAPNGELIVPMPAIIGSGARPN